METQNNLKEQLKTLSEEIQKKTTTQAVLLEYNKYKNNSHIPLSIITLFATQFTLIRMFNQMALTSIIISIFTASVIGISTKYYFNTKKNKLKKQHPNIDFENYNIDENYNKIQKLFTKKFELINELEKVNKIQLNEKETKYINENYEETLENKIEETETKQKIKTLKRM